jgi:hypothetical protein
MGWAGSTHDQRVLRNSNLFQKPDDYFLQHEYILGDSAYRCMPFLLPVFKRNGGSPLTKEQIRYNGALAHLRIAAEHAIGMLKGRFQSLVSLRFLYEEELKMITIIKHVECCIILHNLLINDVVPDDWKEFTEDELLEQALQRMRDQTEGLQESLNEDLDTSPHDQNIFDAGKVRRDRVMNMM